MRVFGAIFVLTAASAFLAGCSGTENDVANYLTDQSKYGFYSCLQIAQNIESTTKRVRELDRLIATSSKGMGGQIINAATYRPEYIMQHGNMNALLRTAREKHCDLAASRLDLNR
jgi:hypothetical protein